MTGAQSNAYQAAYNRSIQQSISQQRSAQITKQRIQSLTAAGRNRSRAATKGSALISSVRSSYLQAAYGTPKSTALAGQLRTQAATASHLQSAYGANPPKARRGKVIGASRTSARRAATARTGQAVRAARQAANRVSSKAPTPRYRTAPGSAPSLNQTWVTAGNDLGEKNCVAVALANHLLYRTGYRVPDSMVEWLGKYWTKTIQDALERIDSDNVWKPAYVTEYGMVHPLDAEPGMVIGYETQQGSHAALLLPGNMVVSWGEVVPLEAEIDEAWEITWTNH
jgi:hypothetical protein